MDAHRKESRFSRIADGLVKALLAMLALTGLWQAYGRWLLAVAKSHVA